MNKERLIELAKKAGWEYADDDRGFEPLWDFAELVRADEREQALATPEERYTHGTPLLDAFTKPAPVQEPVAWDRPIIYTPPHHMRPWVGLTDEEVDDAARYCVKSGQSVNLAIRAIEAKLKEKNT